MTLCGGLDKKDKLGKYVWFSNLKNLFYSPITGTNRLITRHDTVCGFGQEG